MELGTLKLGKDSRQPRWNATEAETELLKAGFSLLRSKGSHRIYGMDELRVTVPFHPGVILHPKVVKQVLAMIEEASSR